MTRAAKERAERWGRRAEFIVAWQLRLKGYTILARRMKTPMGEIDIVARRGRTVAMVEVKARSDLQTAGDIVTPQQRRRIENAAAWLIANRDDLAACQARFDLVIVQPRTWPYHMPDAWRSGD